MSNASASTLIDWHHSRREQRMPTVSIFVGPASLGLREWREWSLRQGRETTFGKVAEAVIFEWFRIISQSADLVALATAWLAQRTNATPNPARMTQYDLDLLWREAKGVGAEPAAAMVYRLLQAAVGALQFDIEAVLREFGTVPFVAGVCGLVPESTWPTMLLIAEPGTEAFPQLMEQWEQIAVAVAQLPLGISVSRPDFDRATSRNTRTMALAKEGEIRVEGVTIQGLAKQLHTVGVPEPLPERAMRVLADNGLSPKVAAAFVDAAIAGTEAKTSPTEAKEEKHRSSSEAFLHEQLELMLPTVGLFHANQQLEFLHGFKRAEADLVSPALKLVIEVDGGYFHLNPEQYRRDRRKDHAYQQHGYWVLRFLAEDVVQDLESILKTILDAVVLRRPATPAEVPAHV